MALLLASFIAGMLTVLAPCILPFLPVIVGGGLAHQDKKSWVRPLVIVLSLSISVVLFSLALKATTALLGVPQAIWQSVSGGIIILLGIHFIFPHLWEAFSVKIGFGLRANKTLGSAAKHPGVGGAILIGAALGPVFSSCSPTYALIIAAILPASFAAGLTYLVAYALGMSVVLFLVIMLGQTVIKKLDWAINPDGLFRKIIGVSFIIVGLSIIFGLDKAAQAYLLERGFYDGSSQFEQMFER